MGETMVRAAALCAAVLALAASTSDGGGGTAMPGEACSEDEECVEGSLCFQNYCVGDGVLRFSVTWSVDSDFDLHVRTPNGNEINWSTTSADGGTLDVDQCVNACGAGTHVENVVFVEGAPLGQYSVWVENFNGRSSGPFTLYTSGVGLDIAPQSETLPATSGAVSAYFLVDYR
jgi:hypothetical protein